MEPSSDDRGVAVTALPVIFDCDPGKDDAFALFLALALPDMLDVRAVTTVAGNAPVDRTAGNARRIVEAAGRPDIPVFAGCARPMLRALDTAEHVHGLDGLGGSGLPGPRRGPLEGHAVTALIRLLDESPAPLTVAAVGPLTNIAMTLIARPDLASKIARLAAMGGAVGRGNATDAAEFNIHVDPHAAHVALAVEAPVTLVTLDVTRPLRPPLAWFEDMEDCGPPGRALAAMWRESPVSLHDVAVAALLAWPDLFDLEACAIRVETGDGAQLGRTLISRGSGPARIVTAVDETALKHRIRKTMNFYKSMS